VTQQPSTLTPEQTDEARAPVRALRAVPAPRDEEGLAPGSVRTLAPPRPSATVVVPAPTAPPAARLASPVPTAFPSPAAPAPQPTRTAPDRIAPPTGTDPVACAPRLVRATAHVGGLPLDALLGGSAALPSSLDVDARLLVVQRRPLPTAPVTRSLAAPADLRREERDQRRMRLIAAGGGFVAAILAGLSIATALG
jgi:hypothetical protein